MSDTAAISSIALSPPGATPRAAAPRVLSDEVDLYAEGNAFSEADWAGAEVADLFGKDGFNFKDIVDVINPLHHLPVVGTVYRALTGDELAPAPRIVGGTLFGGIAGFVVSLANTVMESETGHDAGDAILALFSDDDPSTAVVADASVAAPVAAVKPASAPIPPAAKTVAAFQNTSPLTPAGGIDISAALGATAGDESKNPTAALIRARAAVPQSARPSAVTFQSAEPQASIALPGGKALPIQFRSSKATVTHSQSTATPPLPALQPKTPKAIPDVSGAPPKLRIPPASATATKPASARETIAAAAPPPDKDQDREIASKMMNALEKYESLMRSRTAPSISGEI